jgi:hypothetical protein
MEEAAFATKSSKESASIAKDAAKSSGEVRASGGRP